MKMTVYALYNSYLGCYDQPMFVNIPLDDIKEQYRRSILADTEGAFKARANEKVVCHLGTFDDFTGKFELLPDPVKLIDLATLFPRGYLDGKKN